MATADLSEPACGTRSSTGSLLGILYTFWGSMSHVLLTGDIAHCNGALYTFWGVGFLIVLKKRSCSLPGEMWAKSRAWGSVSRVEGPGVKGLGLKV